MTLGRSARLHHGGVGPSVTRHCRHCWGNCPGNCLVPGQPGACIHAPAKLPLSTRVMLLGSRRFWRRVFWGVWGVR
jgi:hypothetical protein